MSIIVSGAAGFIGSNFVLNWLNNKNEQLIAFDKLTYAGNLENLKSVANNPNYVFVKGDIGDSKLVAKLLQEHQPRAIINFAAESHVDRSIHGPEAFIETNIIGSFRLLECVRDYWLSLPSDKRHMFRFLHVSTDEVYGSLPVDASPFTERFETNRHEVLSIFSSNSGV